MAGVRMRSRAGLPLAVIGLALALASFAGPWWLVTVDYSLFGRQSDETAEFRLLDASAVVRRWNGNGTMSTDYGESPTTRFTFHIAALLLTYAGFLGLGLAAEAGTARSIRDRRNGAVFGLGASALILAAMAYVVVQLPGAVTEDGNVLGVAGIRSFWDTEGWQAFHGAGTVVAGAGWGWFATLGSAASFSLGAIVLLRSGGRPSRHSRHRAWESAP